MSIVFSDERDQLLRDARLGVELEAAKGTFLYKWLILAAKDAREQVIEDFKKVDPSDVGKTEEKQALIVAFDNLEGWINETIAQGQIAHQTLAARGD